MRKVSLAPILLFSLLTLTGGGLAWSLLFGLSRFKLSTDNNVLQFLLFLILFYLFNILFYRIFLVICPIPEGEIKTASKEEFYYNVYLLYRLILFYPLIRTKLFPVPLSRPLYILLGAKLGPNTYSGGTILDPPFTQIGANTIIGEDALIFSHAIEGASLSHQKVIIENNVTIGAKSIIMPGAIIKDGAIIACGSIVTKNTKVLNDEIWAGNPAKKLKKPAT